MIFPWLVQLLVSVALSVVSYVLTPKPKTSKPDAVQQAEAPTAEAGRPIPVLFGRATLTEGNVIGEWDRSSREYQVKV